MNTFGVFELASTRTTSAPGWAYVPDQRAQVQQGGAQQNRKRARNAPGGGPSLSDLAVRQENKTRKELEALDKDAARDNTIPLPGKSGRVQGKHTQNVRRILQSQKTFANHLDDFLALQALQETNAAAAANNKRSSGKRDKDKDKDKETPGSGSGTPLPDGKGDGAEVDSDAPSTLLQGPWAGPLASHPGDSDPLLMSRVPPLPSDEELRRLVSAPPLSYGEARGTWEETYPTRVFCEVCGYWGRVRCMKCGARVCALDCLEAHREECFTRYGM